MTLITGKQLIAGNAVAAGTNRFAATNPATGESLPCEFFEATLEEVGQCLEQADAAFYALQTASIEQIAGLLESIASGLETLSDELLDRTHAETALPIARLQGERARTTGQTRKFADLVRDGSWRQARIDQGDAAREPMPKPDVRTLLAAVGPVVVFGASNFPYAISVAGTDTISALAARCPVVVKAHPGHPGTCELIAQVISAALAEHNLPAGAFSMVQSAGHEVGLALVEHTLTAAVAFTGSLRGGRSLADAVAARAEPIPIYAEMGSTNPVFLLPDAMATRSKQIAEGYLQSVNMGVGQFCTSPGMVFGIEGEQLQSFLSTAGEKSAVTPPATMLHPGIHAAYVKGVERVASSIRVEPLNSIQQPAEGCQAACAIFTAPVTAIASTPGLTDEVFGPVSVVYRCQSSDDMLQYARGMEGSLTATIHGTEQDLQEHAELVQVLQRKVGRLVFNGFPTGIEVCAAMHHGGPYPASTHSGYTSIGQASIFRFAKPSCFQDFPNPALPPELQDANPTGIARLVDGRLTTDSLA
ncbi:NADP-dependent fatty aldehyde dehydrogenase [Posidoniimonas corsicana]|uniref:NADP-dependent fatty aldehyde dehydrogenase n=1 Tax=Posidoniimonas corsicana TaxID=1938618 RepID=A0A5C5V9I9_9BACT|nr:aldehyde dehydrogenase (NADP(+)) [Posidoniimonas corsicana]TWT35238.1 NADP-dependent fatty aldehyde dehydrogenase [Posidoniimonas corsicana]